MRGCRCCCCGCCELKGRVSSHLGALGGQSVPQALSDQRSRAGLQAERREGEALRGGLFRFVFDFDFVVDFFFFFFGGGIFPSARAPRR